MKHNYVDLGLPSGTLWATCNVGANSPEEYGDYFAWGETKPKDSYEDITYKFQYGGSFDIIYTKYNATDYKTTLDPEDDAAAVNWGGKWRIPTDAEWKELMTNCTWTWVEGYNGTDKNGYEVTSKANGNSIFLPAAGYRNDDILRRAGYYGSYLSSLLLTGCPRIAPNFAWVANFNKKDVFKFINFRCYGQSVRPVCKRLLIR